MINWRSWFQTRLEHILTYRGTLLLLSSICKATAGKHGQSIRHLRDNKEKLSEHVTPRYLFGYFWWIILLLWSWRDYQTLTAPKQDETGSSFDLKYEDNDFNDHTFCLGEWRHYQSTKYAQIWHACSVYIPLLCVCVCVCVCVYVCLS